MPSSVASSSGGSPKRRPLMTTAADVVIAATQQPHLMAATTASFAPHAVNSESGPLTPISLIFDSLTFDKRQTRWLKDMERSVETEKKRKRKEWEREVERMREEFLRLYPMDRKWGSDELIVDPFVSRRRGSTDILDMRRMKTMFSNSSHDIGVTSGSPAHAAHHPSNQTALSRGESPERRRFRLRFDLAGFDPESVRVSVDPERIAVRASKKEGERGIRREYGRKIEKPRDVDPSKIKASLTADGVLVVGASIQPSHSPGRHGARPWLRGGAGSRGSSQSRSPPVVGSPIGPAAGNATAELKPCIPVFRDEIGGQRRLHLMVEVGAMFRPGDVTVQVIKDNRLLIRARHEERTSEYIAKNKFSKEIDLPERIDGQSVRGGFAVSGKLFVTAIAKGPALCAGGTAAVSSLPAAAAGGPTTSTAVSVTALASSATSSEQQQQPAAGDDGNGDEQLMPLDIEELLMADARGVELMPCNVLDLASFPPSAPATAIATQS